MILLTFCTGSYCWERTGVAGFDGPNLAQKLGAATGFSLVGSVFVGMCFGEYGRLGCNGWFR